jgi:hypothetical protein
VVLLAAGGASNKVFRSRSSEEVLGELSFVENAVEWKGVIKV